MRPGRWWLALTYALATLLAQGAHDHGASAEPAFLESPGECDDTRPHLGDHESDASPSAPSDCPSCHFRAQHPLAELEPRPLPGPGLAVPTEARPLAILPGAPLRTRCRAPPLA